MELVTAISKMVLGNKLLYLDPHVTQTSVVSEDLNNIADEVNARERKVAKVILALDIFTIQLVYS